MKNPSGRHRRPTEPEARQRPLFGGFAAFKPSLADCIVLLSCMLFAFQLGILEPSTHFQAAQQATSISSAGNPANTVSDAFAYSDSILFTLPSAANSSVTLPVAGQGDAASLTMVSSASTMEISGLSVNGQPVCGPCNFSKKYALGQGQSGNLLFTLRASQAYPAQAGKTPAAAIPFFESSERTYIDDQITILIEGGWKALPNSAMPSSFYWVDAPFHIHRIPILADYLSDFSWPWAPYSFLSLIPPALFYMAGGVSAQYAYKAYHILLFFIPIILFRLFSTKLSTGKNGAFLLSSLIYLFLPCQGMLTGSGADLFFTGLTSRTLATYLSLFSFYFAYEFVFEKKTGSLPFSALFFALAVISNGHILFALGTGLLALLALALVAGRARRTLLLGAACAASVAWFAAPYLLSFDPTAYSRLGGVETSRWGDMALGLFYTGYVALPILFAAGMFRAFKKRETLPLFLSAAGIITYAIAVNPSVNQAFPFIDGIRLLPSVFLPVFFLSGIGALAFFEKAKSLAKWAQKRFSLDSYTATVACALAFALPLAAFFFVVAQSTTGQYSSMANSLPTISEYSSLQKAYGIIGSERTLFLPGNGVSQYPVFDQGFDRSILSSYSSPGELVRAMENAHAKYALFGNAEDRQNASEKSRLEEYLELKNDPRFTEVQYGGAFRLFALDENISFHQVEAGGAGIYPSQLRFDSAKIGGFCPAKRCSLLVFSQSLPGNSKCSGAEGCIVSAAPAAAALNVSGIPHGDFSITLAPENSPLFLPLLAIGAILFIACIHLSRTKHPGL